MSSKSDKQRIFEWIYRQSFASSELEFDEFLAKAAGLALGLSGNDVEKFVETHKSKYWSWLISDIQEDKRKGRTPVFVVRAMNAKRLTWLAADLSQFSSAKAKHRAILLSARPKILGQLDTLNSREFEAIGSVVCRLLKANDVQITPQGNEGGVDVFAAIPMLARTHLLFGPSGPLRIVGQCKKHERKVNISIIRDFITTLDDVKRHDPDVKDLIPTWFRQARGPIVGWLIAHNGFQSGAESKAKNHGLVLSDSRDLAEVLSLSKDLEPQSPPSDRAKAVRASAINELG